MQTSKSSWLSILRNIGITKLQLIISALVATLLLLAIVFTGLNVLEHLQKQDILLANGLQRSARGINQLHREVSRFAILVNRVPEEVDSDQITLQRNLVSSRINILQQHDVNINLDDDILQRQTDVIESWQQMQIDLDTWQSELTNTQLQKTLAQQVIDLEFKINEIASQQEFQLRYQYTQLGLLRTQSLQFLGLIFLLFLIIIAILAYSTLRFIQERQRVLWALQKSQAQYREASQAKSEFLSNMSHELRTPLNGILGYAQILQRHDNLDEKQIEGIQTIRRSGEHLLTLIEDILDIAKIEARKVSLVPSPTDLNDLLQTVVAIVRMRAEQKGLLFSFQLPKALPHSAVAVDEKRLRQILINLLSNAVKFTHTGEVILRVLPLTQSSQTAVLSVRFEIIDTGVGMAKADLERLFQPFEQAGNAQSRGQGTGLGLAISQQLVQLMDSQIHVDSQLGQGSRFWFDLTLPLTSQSNAQLTPEPMIIKYEGQQRLKTLIADDKKQNRMVLLNILEPLGFLVRDVENGRQAVELARSWHPDLILTDLVMPEMTGFEAVKLIREIPECADTVIIAVSASVLHSAQTDSLLVGCNDFIAKPIILSHLLAVLEKHLPITWQYQQQAETMSDVAHKEMAIPSDLEQLQSLFQLALIGDLSTLQEQVTQLANQFPKFKPFAQKLKGLAAEFDDNSILLFLEQCLEHNQMDITPDPAT